MSSRPAEPQATADAILMLAHGWDRADGPDDDGLWQPVLRQLGAIAIGAPAGMVPSSQRVLPLTRLSLQRAPPSHRLQRAALPSTCHC